MESESKGKRKTILLVEDDYINQFAVQKFIDKFYDVIATDNSESAYKIISDKEIDLILMDISIKGNLNGLELTEKIKQEENKKHIPVVALTAHSFPQDRLNCFKAGCTEYLAKPYSREELLNKIHLLLD